METYTVLIFCVLYIVFSIAYIYIFLPRKKKER